MHEQKSQLRILTALLLVVIALAAGLFFYMPSSSHASTVLPPTDQDAPHAKVRDAEISLDPSLIFTQTFGGSGEETIVDIFYNDETLYIFGNTTSSDYDFKSAGAYLAIISASGKTLDFLTYSGTLKAVTLYEGGFVMAIDRDLAPTAVAVGYDGEELRTISIPTVRDEETVDLKYVDGGYLFVTALVQGLTGFTRLKMSILDSSLGFIGSVVTDEVYSLGYIDTLDIMGEYRLMANAMSDIRNMLCIGTWGKKLAHYPQEFSYTVSDFWIVDDFYYLATTESSTLLIKQDGTTIELSGTATRCKMVGDNRYMYISADDAFFCVNNDSIIFSAVYGNTSFYVGDYIYSVSELNNKISVRSFIDGNKAFESTFNYAMKSPKIFTCPNGMFIIGTTQEKFGSSDITIIKVNY